MNTEDYEEQLSDGTMCENHINAEKQVESLDENDIDRIIANLDDWD